MIRLSFFRSSDNLSIKLYIQIKFLNVILGNFKFIARCVNFYSTNLSPFSRCRPIEVVDVHHQAIVLLVPPNTVADCRVRRLGPVLVQVVQQAPPA